LNVTLGQGQITAKADVTDYMTALAFDVAGEIKSLNLAEILNQKDAPVKVEGLIAGAVKASGRAADMTSIAGDGNLEVTDAKLKDMNVLKMVLDKISFLPDVAARVEAGLPEKYKEKLKSQDTEIQKVSTSFLISQGVIKLDPVLVQAEEFVFSGVCTAGFDQTYALDGSVKIPAELSLAMANGVEELKYLYDENSTISLPVRVTGKGGGVPAVAVTQMAIDMGKNILRTEGTRQLEKLLNKAIGGNTPPENVQDPAEQDAPLPDEPTPAKSPESQIIDGIFNSIFK
jgi:hypothetical protein